MKFLLSQLNDLLCKSLSTEEVCSILNSIGMEVEEVEDFYEKYKYFIVARVEECKRHPDSDKLNICSVNTGMEVLQVICGASNVRAGLNIAFAPIGSIVPLNGMQIKKAKIRGVESNGMICSAEELCLGGESEGIMELDEDLVVGSSFAKNFNLNDAVIEVAITPNRGDLCSVVGIARDVAAFLGEKLELKGARNIINHDDLKGFAVNVNTEDCSQFYAVKIEGIDNLETPKYIAEFLKKIGMKPKNLLVDVTNYAMMYYGRPMHAFDSSKISGGLTITSSKKGEILTPITTGVALEIPEGLCVIKDEKGVLSLAGVMGGADSAVNETTKSVVLEIAQFDPIAISRASRAVGIKSDSSYRFERGIDSGNTLLVLNQILDIVIEQNPQAKICGGGMFNKSQPVIAFTVTSQNINQILGMDIDIKTSEKILTHLGCDVVQNNTELTVIAPSWRHDLSISQDAVEEIARIYGYDKIVSTSLPIVVSSDKKQSPFLEWGDFCNALRDVAVGRRMHEVSCYSFVSERLNKNFANTSLFGLHNTVDLIEILNPINANESQMRCSLLPNLFTRCAANIMNGYENFAYFELGNVFNKGWNEGYNQALTLGLVRCGDVGKGGYTEMQKDWDLADIKNDVIALIVGMGVARNVLYDLRFDKIEQGVDDVFHPNMAYKIVYKNKIIGFIGKISEIFLTSVLPRSHNIIMGEIFIEETYAALRSKIKAGPRYTEHSHQLVERELSFILNSSTSVDEVMSSFYTSNVFGENGCSLEEARVNDVFVDETRIGKDKKSVLFKFKIRPQKDITREEIDNKIMGEITTQTVNKFNAVLRDGTAAG